jgi:NOL1/NOP2/sun family putative RNA methylase
MRQNDNFFNCYREIIPEFSNFQESIKTPFPNHVRVNTLKARPDWLIESLQKKGIYLEKSFKKDGHLYHATGLTSPGNLMAYFLGHIHPQALTSCLASIALSPRENSYILDMCAAPGGKTSHLSQLMNNTGLIAANELYPSRHIPLGHTLDRLGILNAVITGYQAQEFPLKQRFDYIMADVPCSGEGRFRKIKAGSAYRETSGKANLPELQKKIILRGFDLLKEKGEMIYATCTYNPEENESVVNFLLQRRDVALLPLNLGFDSETGILEWRNETYDKQLKRAVRFYPHRVNSVGFFMARIGRSG